MISRIPCFWVLLGLLALAGCSREPQRVARPAAGERVTPLITIVGGSWQAGDRSYAAVQLRAEGHPELEPDFLVDAEVPDEFEMKVGVTYYQGEEPLGPEEFLITEHFC